MMLYINTYRYLYITLAIYYIQIINKKMKKHYTRGELALLILKGLAVGGLIVACVALPGLGQILTFFKTDNAHDRHRLRQSIKGLEKQKLVRRYKHKGKEVIEITEKGKLRVLKYEIEHLTIKRLKKWDGIWRVAIFDIEEKKKLARREISIRLKAMGMICIQRSTFISPFLCKDEIDFLGEYFNVRDDIIFMEVHYLDGEKKLKRHFKLS